MPDSSGIADAALAIELGLEPGERLPSDVPYLPCGASPQTGCNHLGCRPRAGLAATLKALESSDLEFDDDHYEQLAVYIHSHRCQARYPATSEGADEAFLDWHESSCRVSDCLH
jgi:hypothetical protein